METGEIDGIQVIQSQDEVLNEEAVRNLLFKKILDTWENQSKIC